MSEIEPIAAPQQAFVSLFYKDALVPVAEALIARNWEISSSDGTARELRKAHLPVMDVETITGWPDMFGGRVKTLHPKVHGGLLADLSDPTHIAQMQEHGVKPIHLLWGNLYDFEGELNNLDATDDSIMEKIDIGGSALMRAAVKGRRLVLTHPDQNEEFLARLRAAELDDPAYVRELAARAFYESARYDSLVMKYLGGTSFTSFVGKLHSPTKYGENAPQKPSGFYADNRSNIDPLALDQDTHVQGMERSHINMLDMSRARKTTIHMAAAYARNFGYVPHMAVGVKHGNATSLAIAPDLAQAVKAGLDADLRAIHGGVMTVNGPIDAELANLMIHHGMPEDTDRLLDGVVGADASTDARDILSRKKLRLVTNPALGTLAGDELRPRRQLVDVLGGMLEQPVDTFVLDFSADYVEQIGEFTEEEKKDMLIAHIVSRHTGSNTITLAGEGRVIGNGGGQQDRIGAGQLALARTTIEVPTLEEYRESVLRMIIELDKDKLGKAVAASDSFFPYEDGPMLLAEAGIKCIITTYKTERHKEILQKVHDTYGTRIIMIHDDIARGFSDHS